MSVTNNRIGVEVTEVKYPGSGTLKSLVASAHVVAIDVDGRKAQGWIHLVKKGSSFAIDSFDEYDNAVPGLLKFVVATQADAVIDAVRSKIAEEKAAA
jgi:hypothetical protein